MSASLLVVTAVCRERMVRVGLAERILGGRQSMEGWRQYVFRMFMRKVLEASIIDHQPVWKRWKQWFYEERVARVKRRTGLSCFRCLHPNNAFIKKRFPKSYIRLLIACVNYVV